MKSPYYFDTMMRRMSEQQLAGGKGCIVSVLLTTQAQHGDSMLYGISTTQCHSARRNDAGSGPGPGGGRGWMREFCGKRELLREGETRAKALVLPAHRVHSSYCGTDGYSARGTYQPWHRQNNPNSSQLCLICQAMIITYRSTKWRWLRSPSSCQ